jgi:hypothetical protein
MKKNIFIILFSISYYSYGINSCNVLADTSKTDSVKVTQKFRKIKLGVDYASVNTVNGRQDTSVRYTFSPSLEYIGKLGLFGKLSLIHVPATKRVFDELSADAGWNFTFSDKWDGGIGYSHYFFDTKAAMINAAISNRLNVNAGYDWDILYSYLDIDWIGGNNKFPVKVPANPKKTTAVLKKTNDVFVTFSNSHQFSFDDLLKKGDYITITPNADILCGTQNYLITYKGKTDVAYKKYQEQAAKFNITGYMLYLELKYKIKGLALELAPDYIFPENVPAGESTKPFFVMNAGIFYTFKHK